MRVIATAMAAVLGAGGCVQDARFDPRGCDWNLFGEWEVAGGCGDDSGGITEVQLFVWNEDDSETWTDSQVLLFNCTDLMIDTAATNPERCMATGRYLVTGNYQAQWVARDSLNNILDCTGTLIFPPPVDNTIELPPVELFPDALDGSGSSILDLCPALDRPGVWP